jgi:hypothetical protein
MTTYTSTPTRAPRKPFPWRALADRVKLAGLPVAGLALLAASAFVALGPAGGLCAAGVAALLLEWRFRG